MELRHLRYFVAVAEEGSLTLAAEKRLHTAQPSLSRQLRDLEEEVGATLFLRGARGVELTPAGRAFLDHARLALSQANEAIAAARRAARRAPREAGLLGVLHLGPGGGLAAPGDGDLAVGYRADNPSPVLATFLAGLDRLIAAGPAGVRTRA